MIPDGERTGQPSEFVVLAMGKFGGREINYHSDLDMVFLYEADGGTFHAQLTTESGETTTNQHFFSELGQRIIKVGSQAGPHGRLYEIDPRLRPTGRSGSLATSLEELRRYFKGGQGQLWERQALCKARVVYGTETAAAAALEAVTDCAYRVPWQTRVCRRNFPHAPSLGRNGQAEQSEARPRWTGRRGIHRPDVAAQAWRQHPEVRVPGTLEALAALEKIGHFRAAISNFSTPATVRCWPSSAICA